MPAARLAAPHFNAPRPAASRLATAPARHNGRPSLPSATTRLSRHLNNTPATSSARRESLRGNASTRAGAVANNARGRPLTSNTGFVGQRPGSGRELSQTAGLHGLQMHYTNHTPILRNAALASLSPRGSATRSTSKSTFRGNFAQSSFARDWDRHHHHRHFGIVLGFIGPVFWPYAYDDFVDYTFSPYAYDTFWPYAFDDVYEGIYGAYAPQYDAPEGVYAYAGAPASDKLYDYATGTSGRSRTAALTGGVSQICSDQAEGLSNFPIERIAQQVEPDRHQQALLADLKASTAKAVNILQRACPNELPSTPTGRIATMRSRIEVMLQAVQAVRPALDAFYRSLSDEQKERFNALDQDINAASRQTDIAGLCSGPAGRGAALPVDRIERTLRLSDHQDAALRDLNDASAKAANILKGNCQPDRTVTPTGRLTAMEDRLNSTLQAIDTVQPALAKFYNSLNDEQKGRFNQLGARPA